VVLLREGSGGAVSEPAQILRQHALQGDRHESARLLGDMLMHLRRPGTRVAGAEQSHQHGQDDEGTHA
jgi:hypothetical protein